VVRSEGGQGAAVLLSGGLDSAVLLADVARREVGERQRPERDAPPPSAGIVVPIYVSVGLAWEQEELAMLDRLLRARPFRAVQPLETLRFDMRDVYPPTHWAIRGEPPGFDTPDEDVYLEGRNVVLLTKAAVFMARAGLARVFIGPLAGNPFPDATPAFFAAMSRALSLGLGTPIEIGAPFAEQHKAEVIALGRTLGVPLELTLSCMQPAGGLHCGRCSKCRERRDAFREAGVDDPTAYTVAPIR
jgi:7-cyano-7-deazaguanine synthase